MPDERKLKAYNDALAALLINLKQADDAFDKNGISNEERISIDATIRKYAIMYGLLKSGIEKINQDKDVPETDGIERKAEEMLSRGYGKFMLREHLGSSIGEKIVCHEENADIHAERKEINKRYAETITYWVDRYDEYKPYLDDYENKNPGEKTAEYKKNAIKYIERTLSDKAFDEYNNTLEQGKKITADVNAAKDKFYEYWNFNRAMMEVDAKADIGIEKLFECSMMKEASEDHDAVELARRLTEKETSLRKETLTTEQCGALKRSFYYLLEDESTPGAKERNDEIIANLRSNNPAVVKAQRELLYQKLIDKTMAIKDEELKEPDDLLLAKNNAIEKYKEYHMLFEMQNISGIMLHDGVIDEQTRKILMHKSELYQSRIARFEHEIKGNADPDKKIKNFLSNYDPEELIFLPSANGHGTHQIDREVESKLVPYATGVLMQGVFNGKKTPLDAEHYDNKKFTIYKEYKLPKGEVLNSDKLDTAVYGSDNNKIKPVEFNMLLAKQENFKVVQFAKGRCVGADRNFSFKNGKLVESRKAISRAFDASSKVNNNAEQIQMLKRIRKALSDTDPALVRNSPEFRRVKTSFDELIKFSEKHPDLNALDAQKSRELYGKLNSDITDYISVKMPKLQKNPKDVRGAERVGLLNSLVSVTNESHVAKIEKTCPSINIENPEAEIVHQPENIL